MLKWIGLKNFTVFEDAEFNFGPGLNVVIGGNGTGKTHLLKMGHCLLNSIRLNNPDNEEAYYFSNSFVSWNIAVYFQATKETDFARKNNVASWGIKTDYFNMKKPVDDFSDWLLNDFAIFQKRSIIIPPKEVLTFSNWLPGISEKFNIKIDQSYPDILKHLSVPTLKDLLYLEAITQIESIIGGEIIKDGDKFYIKNQNGGRFESSFVAEGHRKLAMIAYLLKNGSLNKDITLFWDEPEANLNPILIRKLANILTILASNGFQIVLATHSLFLMKELHLLSKEKENLPVHYIGLIKENDSVRVTEAEDLDDLELIESLEAELDQSIRYLNS